MPFPNVIFERSRQRIFTAAWKIVVTRPDWGADQDGVRDGVQLIRWKETRSPAKHTWQTGRVTTRSPVARSTETGSRFSVVGEAAVDGTSGVEAWTARQYEVDVESSAEQASLT